VKGLTSEVRSWLEQGAYARVDGVDVFYRVAGEDRPDLPWLVCFHGFPTSSWDWHSLLPQLEKAHRVLVFDFPGYGLSAKPPERDYSLKRQLDASEDLLRHLQIRAFDLLTHDMGNSVGCELLRRRERGDYPFELRSLSLLNGGIYMELHHALFRRQYPNVYADPSQFDEQHYRSQWSLMLHNGGRRVLHRIAGYMRERTRMGEQWTGPLERLDLPFRVIWGDCDPIAVYAIAQRLCGRNPHAALHTLEGVGHYPQLEAPRRVAEALGF
jgi:pimeloyl-ACP methyl ester carboxylesterase